MRSLVVRCWKPKRVQVAVFMPKEYWLCSVDITLQLVLLPHLTIYFCFSDFIEVWTNLLTYFLTPLSRVLLEKLTCSQLVKKFPAFYGTRRFITAFTSTRYLSLSWASSIQSLPSHPTSWRSIFILSSHQRLGLPSGITSSGFPSETLYTPLLSPYVLHVPPTSFFFIWSPEQYWVKSTDHIPSMWATKFHTHTKDKIIVLYI
jgi:hypothetical protein